MKRARHAPGPLSVGGRTPAIAGTLTVETTRKELLMELIESQTWWMNIDLHGQAIRVAWVRSEHPVTGAVDARLRVLEAPDGLEDVALEIARTTRRLEVRKEIDQALLALSPLTVITDEVYELYLASAGGEFVGQSAGGKLYVQDVAAILDLPTTLVMDAVEQLSRTRTLGLVGMILTDYQTVMNMLEAEKAATGHWALSESDDGWECGACGKQGPRGVDPVTVDCVDEPSGDGIMRAS